MISTLFFFRCLSQFPQRDLFFPVADGVPSFALGSIIWAYFPVIVVPLESLLGYVIRAQKIVPVTRRYRGLDENVKSTTIGQLSRHFSVGLAFLTATSLSGMLVSPFSRESDTNKNTNNLPDTNKPERIRAKDISRNSFAFSRLFE
jgi:hypothetical protein